MKDPLAEFQEFCAEFLSLRTESKLEALIAECRAGREMRDTQGGPLYSRAFDEKKKKVDSYDQTRRATDACLGGGK